MSSQDAHIEEITFTGVSRELLPFKNPSVFKVPQVKAESKIEP